MRVVYQILTCIPLLLSSAAFGSVVYSNTTTDTGDTLSYSANAFTEIGDEIQLAGAERVATSATVQFFNIGSEGTFDAVLRLFDVGSPVGAQIGSDITATGIVASAGGVFNVTFTLPSLTVPDNLIFTVSLANVSSGVDLGLDMFEPPTIGSSDNSFAIANDGSGYVQILTPGSSEAGENVFFELDANPVGTPEPVEAAVVGMLLVAIACLRRRTF